MAFIDVKEEEAKTKEQGEDQTCPYTPMGYAPANKGRPLNASSSIQCFAKFKEQHAINSTEAFLASLTVDEKGAEDGRMITWLEIYFVPGQRRY